MAEKTPEEMREAVLAIRERWPPLPGRQAATLPRSSCAPPARPAPLKPWPQVRPAPLTCLGENQCAGALRKL